MKKLLLIVAAAAACTVAFTAGKTAEQQESCCAAKNVADTITIPGGRWLDTDMKVTVAVPDGYRCGNDTTHYPTVYLLNGHGGHYKSWGTLLNLDSAATAYGCIIVCPSSMNSWYWDAPINPGRQMESFFVESLIPTIDSLYRTIPCRTQRAITGFSMGGHGALWLAIRHKDLFASAGATSGGVDIRPFPKNWNMAKALGTIEEYPERWDSHTVATAIDSLKPGDLNIIFDCGTDDFFYKVNCQLDSALNKRGIFHTFITNPGAHTAAYWHKSIIPQLDYFKAKRMGR